MGNCIGSAPARAFEEYDQELNDSAVVAGKISSGPCSDEETLFVRALCNGSLPPLSALLKSVDVQLDTADGSKRMKIVVNRKQLQLLQRSLEELKLRHFVIQSVRKRGKKWRLSLATIPEVWSEIWSSCFSYSYHNLATQDFYKGICELVKVENKED